MYNQIIQRKIFKMEDNGKDQVDCGRFSNSILKLAKKLFFGADGVAAKIPDLIIFKGQDGKSGRENRPEIFRKGFGIIIEGIKTGQIPEMRPATVGIGPSHHSGQDQDQRRETVDD